jgi:lysophospholipase L1-like esterase
VQTFHDTDDTERLYWHSHGLLGPAGDGVIDFDAAVRDPAKPSQMKDGLHMGDHLHGSDAGYTAMANAIDLGLFR